MSEQSNEKMEVFVEKWKEVKTVINALELDAVKYQRGVRAAGLRFRKGIREVKRMMSDLVRESVNEDREFRESKKSKSEE